MRRREWASRLMAARRRLEKLAWGSLKVCMSCVVLRCVWQALQSMVPVFL